MLVFVDGMSHYTDAFLGEKWDFRDTSANGCQHFTTGGRFDRGRVNFNGTSPSPSTTFSSQHLQKTYSGVGTIICGFALAQTAVQNPNGGWLIHFMDGSTVQIGIKIEQSGQLRVFRGAAVGGGIDPTSQAWTSATVTLGMSTNAISSSAFDFIEIKIVHDPATGSVEIKRNGSAFFSLTNINTAFSGASNSSSIIFGGHRGISAITNKFEKAFFDLCDVHLLNTVVNGSDANDPVDFIGDRTWEPITPTADGADTAWTITGSASHFENIDENPPNTTDFNSAATVNARDGFIVSSPSGPSAASALIALTHYCQKNTGGSNAIKGFMRSAGGSYQLGTEFQIPSPWAFRQSFLATKPGGGQITIADVGTHQFGMQKTI